MRQRGGGQDIQNEIGYQKIDYRYNIRGWLTHINDIDDLSDPNAQMGDLFAFKINYNEITEVDNGDMNFVATSFNNTVKPLFNGNIAETYWKSRTDNILRKYSYSYDNLNRLRKAYFQKPYDVVSHTQSFDEYIDYDKNGNIFRLQRFADQNEYGNVIEIDALGYHYQQHSNKLMKVTDVTNFSAGFGDDSDGTNDTDDDYTYDENGNMISDENKGITSIKYNHLNLPTEISFVNGRIHYLYNALGVKVSKIVIQPGNDPVETDYLGGFQYVKNELQFFPHPEGYVSVVKFGPDNLVINYAYQYKDHLGNIRLNYGKDPETNVLKVLEENHYYPFGLKHQNYNTGRKQYGKKEDEITTLQFPGLVLPTEQKPMVYKYKYNGKEWQDELGLNFYDYGARNYDPAIGRWMNIDPLAYKYLENSPYCYTLNNPILFSDPDGKRVVWGEGLSAEQKMEIGSFVHNLRKNSEVFNEIFNMLHAAENEYSINGSNSEDENAGLGAGALVLPNLESEISGFDNNHIPIMKDGKPGASLTFFYNNLKNQNVNVGDVIAEEFVHMYQQQFYVGDGSFDYNKKDYGTASEFEAKAISGIIKKQAGMSFYNDASGWAENKGVNYNKSNVNTFQKDLNEWLSLPNLSDGYTNKVLNNNYVPSLLISILKR